MKKFSISKKGFTLTEMIVAITIFVLIVVAIFSVQTLTHRAYREGENIAEITQNGRVILERMVREIRQAKEIVTELADEEANGTSTILFQDGNDLSTIRYIHYFKENREVKRQVIAYYFSPGTYVSWDAKDENGNPPSVETLEEPRTIGEYVDTLNFWAGPGVINISLSLKKNNKTLNLRTKVLGRNL
jgi:prepilin-type N-terminal cleavage/methylation domain-containing protein